MSQQHPINIRLIDHVVVRAVDLETMVSFYRDVLGCRLERGPGELGLAQLRAGSSLIDIIDLAGPLGREGGRAPERQAPNMDHFCVQVEPWDVEAIRAHLGSHGVETGDLVMRYGALGNGPSLYIYDPAGNRVELKGPPHESGTGSSST
jgi:catechol 2,3-dioxygenase-like lactoylglutathione lyase family enzyme